MVVNYIQKKLVLRYHQADGISLD